MEQHEKCANCQEKVEYPLVGIGFRESAEKEEEYYLFCNKSCCIRWITDNWQEKED